MLKHVHITLRNRADSVSQNSSPSSSCASSLCGSPEPPNEVPRTPSRASSYSSLTEAIPQTTVKVYTACLRLDIEYKTLGVAWDTTAKEVVQQCLRRCKVRNRDPRLFYLTMEITDKRSNAQTYLILNDDTRPALLQACHNAKESRFCLQIRPGGLVRVHTSALQPTSQYKSLLISEETTSDELLGLLLACYNSIEQVEQFSLYEVCPDQEYQRKLHPDDLPLLTQLQRNKKGEKCHFMVRKNPSFSFNRQHSKAIKRPKDLALKLAAKSLASPLEKTPSPTSSNYNPVYNVKELRTACNSFSVLGSDKKLLDIEVASNRRHSIAVEESVNTHPSRGIGIYVYV